MCPKCGSTDVSYSFLQVGTKSKTNSTSILRKLGRLCLILMTCGLWVLVPKRRLHTSTTVQNQKVGICQSCGHSWNIK